MKRTLSNADLQIEAQKIDAFPFDQLPKDLIFKIFMDSGFTVGELHKLCNLSKKLKAICTDRKVWEQVLFKHVLGYGQAMRVADRRGTLPELLNDIRQTNEFYAIWLVIREYEPFVILTAIQLWKKFIETRQIWFLHDADDEFTPSNSLIFQERARCYEISISFTPNAQLRDNYIAALDAIVALVTPAELLSNTRIPIRNVYTGVNYETARLQLSKDIHPKTWVLYFSHVLSNGWNLFELTTRETQRVFDTTPLAACIICGNISFEKLGRCSCPCDKIFCSVDCQRKVH